MTVKDIYDTRFDDNNHLKIRKRIGILKQYTTLYEGTYKDIPMELFKLEVESLKPVSPSNDTPINMVVFCKELW